LIEMAAGRALRFFTLGLSLIACGWLTLISCGYGDTTPAPEPASAVEACETNCTRLDALRCPEPLAASVLAACSAECAELTEQARFESCEPNLRAYYECLGKQGNARCLGASFEYGDECLVQSEARQACLEGRTPSSGLCPDTYPIDCGNGFCCPASHPLCSSGGLCGQSGCSRGERSTPPWTPRDSVRAR
jgi:hypothetical protein